MAQYISRTGTLAEPVAGEHFRIPDLCTAPAISLVVLIGELLAIVLLFAGAEVSWMRLALLSMFVQWVALISTGLLCLSRPLYARLPLVPGALLAFATVLAVTLGVGFAADRLVAAVGQPVDWGTLVRELVIAAIIAALLLRYFYVQQQLRMQEQSELRSRIQALQSRIRPHFLFNSMNIIASLIESDPRTAESVVEDLSELFRASLNEAGSQVPLADELALCERYVRIESLRLGERLTVDWQLEPVPAGVRIPLLTLQPLLENAIYHGIQPLPEGGTIGVRLWQQDGRVIVEIENPLAAQPANTEGNRMAMENIRVRLAVLYGNRAELAAGRRDERYVTTLTLPLEHAAPSRHTSAGSARNA
ncbi:MAG TPA: sensor histidine kinase [Pseudomonadales bacterium]